MAGAIHRVTLSELREVPLRLRRIAWVATWREIDMLKPTDKSASGGERVTGLAIRLGKQCTAFRVLIEARQSKAQFALAPPGQGAAKEQNVQARWSF